MAGASFGLLPRDVLGMTPKELGLYARGRDKSDYHETCRAMTAAYLAGTLPRMKKPKRLADYLPNEPLTKLEKKRKMWNNIDELAAMGIGKTKTMTIEEFLAREERQQRKKKK